MEPKEFHWPFSLIYSSITRFMKPAYYDIASRMKISETTESLLDMGGGDARLSIALAQMYPQLKRIVSVDISEDMTRRAQSRISHAGLSSIISASCQDVHKLTFNDSEFEAVVSFGALHHWKQSNIVFAEAYRVLKPGCKICVIDGYGRPSLSQIHKVVKHFGCSFASSIAYWCGSRDVLHRDQISHIVSDICLPEIKLSFDELLTTIQCIK